MDIGPKSAENFAKIITSAKTVVWNGPAGVFEKKVFEKGTKALLDAVVAATKSGSVTIVGNILYLSAFLLWK